MSFIDEKIKGKLHDIIFGTDTTAGKTFDVILIIIIFSNSILVVAESVDVIRNAYDAWITILGWVFVVMTLEIRLK